MINTNGASKLQVKIDTHHCRLSPAEKDRLLTSLDGLGRQVAHFPIADLHVLIEFNNRNNDYSVKTTLILPGTTLVGNDHDTVHHAAFERCLGSLLENVHAYKDRLGRVPERQKQQEGTHQQLEPNPPPDPRAIDEAVEAGDYSTFRTATFGYDEGIRRATGRWVERYPDMDASIGHGLTVDDIIEEVFLMAFEGYPSRPRAIRFADWLVGLVDAAVKELQRHGSEELENIRMARTARAAERGTGAV